VHQQLPQRSAIRSQYRATGNLDARAALHERYSTNPLGWQCWVFDQLRVPLDGSILELGCGPAYLWQENADRTLTGWHVTLTDASTGMVRAASWALRTALSRFTYAVADAQSIPFPTRSFDAVIANHMLYHVPDQARALSEIRRVLLPSGSFYASTVGQAHMRELHEMLEQVRPSQRPSAGITAASFLLGNGADLLAPWFTHVDLLRYDDSLVIDQAEPLLAYARSMLGPKLDPPALARLTRLIERGLAANGAIRIAKDSGLFIARGLRSSSPSLS